MIDSNDVSSYKKYHRINMYNIPPINLAIKINEIINQDKEHFKEYQDRSGKINFNVLIGFILGTICSFNMQVSIKTVMKMFLPMFEKDQLKDYTNLMLGLNNYLVCAIEAEHFEPFVMEDNKWVPVFDADFKSLYTLWCPFFTLMKAEFEHEKDHISKLSANAVVAEALKYFHMMSDIMDHAKFDDEHIEIMVYKFPLYAKKFNELRKLIFVSRMPIRSTVH